MHTAHRSLAGSWVVTWVYEYECYVHNHDKRIYRIVECMTMHYHSAGRLCVLSVESQRARVQGYMHTENLNPVFGTANRV